MDAERLRVQADLRGLLDGEVFCDPVQTQLYASDAGSMKLCRSASSDLGLRPMSCKPSNMRPTINCRFFPRGGGTGFGGQALGAGLVLDFSRYMRRVGAT